MASKLKLGVLVLTLVAGSAWAGEAIVGPGVGNADSLVSEGTKLFNQKKYAKAADLFLKATRANPANVSTYLQLARASFQAKALARACYAYRVYLKATPETVADRKKASLESDQCDRQARSGRNPVADPGPTYVDTRASFFAALEKDELLGANGATDSLRTLAKEGFLGPELGEMATKLGAAAVAQADAIHKRALALEKLPADSLRSARPLYTAALDVGASPPDSRARIAFLDGLAELAERDYKKADSLFGEAMKADAANKEYVYYRALTLFQSGEKAQALKLLEADLKDDPRTAVLRTAQALNHSADTGAAELEKLLFTTRFATEK